MPALPAAGNLSGLNEPPYPHVQVRPGGGGVGGRLVWSVTEEVIVEVWCALNGTPGSAAAKKLLMEFVYWLCRACDRPHVAGRPVVVDVVMVGAARPGSDAATRQPKWSATVKITAHPDNTHS